MEGQKFRESKARIDGDPVSMSGAGPGALIRLRSEVVTAKDLLGVAAVLGVVRDVCGEQATPLAHERPSRPGRLHSSRKAPSARRVSGLQFHKMKGAAHKLSRMCADGTILQELLGKPPSESRPAAAQLQDMYQHVACALVSAFAYDFGASYQDFLGGDLESFVPDDLRHLVPTAQASWRKTIKVHSSACANAGAAVPPNVGILLMYRCLISDNDIQTQVSAYQLCYATAPLCAGIAIGCCCCPLWGFP